MAYIGSKTKPKQPRFIFHSWIELRYWPSKLISFLYTPNYIGAEEGLPEMSCWGNKEHAPENFNYLHFDVDEIWGADYQDEFSNSKNRIPSLMSEEEARKLVIQIKDGVFVDAKGIKVQGYGKFVLKPNGCLAWREYINENSHHHTIFNKGKRILAGGWMAFKDGALLCVNRATGHYRSDKVHLDYLISYLESFGIQISPDVIRDSIKFDSCCRAVEISGIYQGRCKRIH